MRGEVCFAVHNTPTKPSQKRKFCSKSFGPKAPCVIAWAPNSKNCVSSGQSKKPKND